MSIDLNPDLAQWFTPEWLAQQVGASIPLSELYFGAHRIIEPAAGNGALLHALKLLPIYGKIDVVEIDGRFKPELARYEEWHNECDPLKMNVEICNYLERPAPEERYSIAITNPPFTRGMEAPFMAKLLDECNFIVAVLPSRSFHGLARYDAIWERFNNLDPDAPEWAIRSIKYCKRRPKFAGTNGGKDEIVIVAVQRRSSSRYPITGPRISWI